MVKNSKSIHLNEGDKFCLKVNDKLSVAVIRNEDEYTVAIYDCMGGAIHIREVSDFEVEVYPMFENARDAAYNYLKDEVCSSYPLDSYVIYDDDSFYTYGLTAKIRTLIREDIDCDKSSVRYHRVNILDFMTEEMRTRWLEERN